MSNNNNSIFRTPLLLGVMLSLFGLGADIEAVYARPTAFVKQVKKSPKGVVRSAHRAAAKKKQAARASSSRSHKAARQRVTAGRATKVKVARLRSGSPARRVVARGKVKVSPRRSQGASLIKSIAQRTEALGVSLQRDRGHLSSLMNEAQINQVNIQNAINASTALDVSIENLRRQNQVNLEEARRRSLERMRREEQERATREALERRRLENQANLERSRAQLNSIQSRLNSIRGFRNDTGAGTTLLGAGESGTFPTRIGQSSSPRVPDLPERVHKWRTRIQGLVSARGTEELLTSVRQLEEDIKMYTPEEVRALDESLARLTAAARRFAGEVLKKWTDEVKQVCVRATSLELDDGIPKEPFWGNLVSMMPDAVDTNEKKKNFWKNFQNLLSLYYFRYYHDGGIKDVSVDLLREALAFYEKEERDASGRPQKRLDEIALGAVLGGNTGFFKNAFEKMSLDLANTDISYKAMLSVLRLHQWGLGKTLKNPMHLTQLMRSSPTNLHVRLFGEGLTKDLRLFNSLDKIMKEGHARSWQDAYVIDKFHYAYFQYFDPNRSNDVTNFTPLAERKDLTISVNILSAFKRHVPAGVLTGGLTQNERVAAMTEVLSALDKSVAVPGLEELSLEASIQTERRQRVIEGMAGILERVLEKKSLNTDPDTTIAEAAKEVYDELLQKRFDVERANIKTHMENGFTSVYERVGNQIKVKINRIDHYNAQGALLKEYYPILASKVNATGKPYAFNPLLMTYDPLLAMSEIAINVPHTKTKVEEYAMVMDWELKRAYKESQQALAAVWDGLSEQEKARRNWLIRPNPNAVRTTTFDKFVDRLEPSSLQNLNSLKKQVFELYLTCLELINKRNVSEEEKQALRINLFELMDASGAERRCLDGYNRALRDFYNSIVNESLGGNPEENDFVKQGMRLVLREVRALKQDFVNAVLCIMKKTMAFESLSHWDEAYKAVERANPMFRRPENWRSNEVFSRNSESHTYFQLGKERTLRLLLGLPDTQGYYAGSGGSGNLYRDVLSPDKLISLFAGTGRNPGDTTLSITYKGLNFVADNFQWEGFSNVDALLNKIHKNLMKNSHRYLMEFARLNPKIRKDIEDNPGSVYLENGPRGESLYSPEVTKEIFRTFGMIHDEESGHSPSLPSEKLFGREYKRVWDTNIPFAEEWHRI